MKKEIIVYSPFPDNDFPRKIYIDNNGNSDVRYGGVLKFIPYNLLCFDEVTELMQLLASEKLKITIECVSKEKEE